jgi:hypothetical protein
MLGTNGDMGKGSRSQNGGGGYRLPSGLFAAQYGGRVTDPVDADFHSGCIYLESSMILKFFLSISKRDEKW